MFSSGIADLFMIILLPVSILYKSLENYPEIWTTFTPKPYMYYSTKIEFIPRKKQSDFDYSSWQLDLEQLLGRSQIKAESKLIVSQIKKQQMTEQG